MIFVDATGPLYRCGPKWFGKRLADGSALLIGAYSVSRERNTPASLPGPDIAKHRERVAKVPRAVIWLNDAKNPTRGEYYYSAIALEDPRSRLTEIRSEIVAVSTDYVSLSDPADEVPWLASGRGERRTMAARYVNVVPRELWSNIPGLKRKLRIFSGPTVLYINREISQNQTTAINMAGLVFYEKLHSYQWPLPNIISFEQTFSGSSRSYFEQSTRRKLVHLDTNQNFYIVESAPAGVIPVSGEGYKKAIGVKPNGINIDNKLLKVEKNKWPTAIFYNPKTGNLYRIAHFFLSRQTFKAP